MLFLGHESCMVAKFSSFYIAEVPGSWMRTISPIVGANVPEPDKATRKAVHIYERRYLSRVSWMMPVRYVRGGLPVSMEKQHPIREAGVVVDYELEVR